MKLNSDLENVFFYHEETKHGTGKYAKSLGYLDWNTQPNPFRSYKGALKVSLPLALENTTPPYHLIFEQDIPTAPLLIESISQLLQFSLGLAAWKEYEDSKWALRCNASSGNLHPTEAYVILPPMKDINHRSTINHYAPKDHALETLSCFDTKFWDTLPQNSFIVGLSSVLWREVWKYGERAFRYCHLDTGHAFKALDISAKMLGWSARILDNIQDDDIDRILGLNQQGRFSEVESADILILVTPDVYNEDIDLSLVDDVSLSFDSIANTLSSSMYAWDIIPMIDKVCKGKIKSDTITKQQIIKRAPTLESKKVVLNRRSAQMMQKDHAKISSKEFFTLLGSCKNNFMNRKSYANLVIFVHEVDGLDSGIYIYMRNEDHINILKENMKSAFLWANTDLENLYLLEKGDFKKESKSISCNQSIASHGAFSLGMICEFEKNIKLHGTHRYKELYWECGAIGQELYLEATSLGLDATGIGCFLDDMMHALLGLEGNLFCSLYHFTVGRAVLDSRILSLPPYENINKDTK